MKKLMVIAAAALCAGMTFGDDAIASANVVGYNTLNTGDKTVMLGSTFQAMDADAKTGDGILLGDLQGSFEDEDNIQVAYISGGRVKFTDYIYYTEDYGYDEAGWYDKDDNLVSQTVRIPMGSAVWFKSASGSAKDVTAAGSVYASSFTHTFKEKSEMVCSAFPVAFNPNAVTWTGIQDEDNIQVASVVSGKVKFTDYIYYTEDYGYDVAGWYDEDDNLVNAPIAAVGQGFWLKLGSPTSVTMVETNPIE